MRLRSVVVGAGLLLFACIIWNAAVAAPKKKPAEKILVVQDFEASDLSKLVHASKMKGERFALAGRDAGHAYRCTAAGGREVVWLTLRNIPKDVTGFREIRFRIRGRSASKHAFQVRLLNNPDSLGMEGSVKKLSAEWATVSVLLPAMRVADDFDPKKVEAMEILWFDAPAFSFEIDDVQLVEVKGTGGWRHSAEEMIVMTFGAKRAKKVKHLQTKHFDIYTDSAAARRKFPKALEETYDFVRATLRVPEFKKRLPVYIHQNSKLYFDFCVRYVGWPLESAQNSAGHGSGRYFTTYYQSPKSDVVTHELTHSIFHRSVGGWGGSWLQEGVAVYVEYLAVKKSAAGIFAPTLRGGRHTPLRKFITIDRLIDAHNRRGGSSTVASLYLQAGAFFEFLMRSDVLQSKTKTRDDRSERGAGDALPKAISDLATLREEGAELAKKVEAILGMSIEDLEKAWILWGGHPPKLK